MMDHHSRVQRDHSKIDHDFMNRFDNIMKDINLVDRSIMEPLRPVDRILNEAVSGMNIESFLRENGNKRSFEAEIPRHLFEDV